MTFLSILFACNFTSSLIQDQWIIETVSHFKLLFPLRLQNYVFIQFLEHSENFMDCKKEGVSCIKQAAEQCGVCTAASWFNKDKDNKISELETGLFLFPFMKNEVGLKFLSNT